MQDNADTLDDTVEETEVVPQEDVVLDEVTTAEPAKAKRDNSHEVNMAKMREAKERAEHEKQELADQLAALQEAVDAPGSEDFIEGRHLKKGLDKINKRLDENEEKRAYDASRAHIMGKYPDFDSVVSPENVKRLNELDPEMAETLGSSSAPYHVKAAAVYKRISELNLANKYKKEKTNAEANAAKPRPVNSVSPQTGDSPLSVANAFADGLTDELKKEYWRQTREAANRG